MTAGLVPLSIYQQQPAKKTMFALIQLTVSGEKRNKCNQSMTRAGQWSSISPFTRNILQKFQRINFAHIRPQIHVSHRPSSMMLVKIQDVDGNAQPVHYAEVVMGNGN